MIHESPTTPTMTGDIIRVVHWQRDRRNNRIGYAAVSVDPPGIILRRIVVLAQGGTNWITLPAAPLLDASGHPQRDDRGKIVYEAVLAFADDAAKAAFRDAVLAGVLALDEEAFGEAQP